VFFVLAFALRYLRTTVTNQNLIQQEIKRRLNSGNALPFGLGAVNNSIAANSSNLT
jgi:hypothetical protein